MTHLDVSKGEPRTLSRKRKLVFAVLTTVLFFGTIEAVARAIWWRLERKAFDTRESAGREVLRNDGISYMKIADGRYGYSLKPGYHFGTVTINQDGFHQKDVVPIRRTPGVLRVVCLGESTTFGNDVDNNYPSFLRGILNRGGVRAEVINAGVPGWVSDQVALQAELQLAQYRPDAVILYVGWNDFQSYTPFRPAPAVSYWHLVYEGNVWKQQATTWLRSVALLSAAYYKDTPEANVPSAPAASTEGTYRFLFQNLERTVRAFRNANPDAAIFVSTLVGRWPVGTPEDWKAVPPVWWMTEHKVSLADAAGYVQTLNDQIRSFARSHDVTLLDAAAAFEPLDRVRLQYDWAHMVPDGYELLAWTMVDALVDEGLVRKSLDDSRAGYLRSQYAVRRPPPLLP